jgi:uncharacterized membrane protein
MTHPTAGAAAPNETARLEAFSDGVFAIAITLLILEIKVPHAETAHALSAGLRHLWPSYLAYLASFTTIGVMWLNHHRLFSLIHRSDDGLIAFNLLLLLGVTWVPFPTALLAEHLLGEGQRVAGLVYAATFFALAIVFNVMWRYAVRAKVVREHLNVAAITRQYAMGPVLYGILIVVALFNAVACLVLSALIALYFALPPSLWARRAKAT